MGFSRGRRCAPSSNLRSERERHLRNFERSCKQLVQENQREDFERLRFFGSVDSENFRRDGENCQRQPVLEGKGDRSYKAARDTLVGGASKGRFGETRFVEWGA